MPPDKMAEQFYFCSVKEFRNIEMELMEVEYDSKPLVPKDDDDDKKCNHETHNDECKNCKHFTELTKLKSVM